MAKNDTQDPTPGLLERLERAERAIVALASGRDVGAFATDEHRAALAALTAGPRAAVRARAAAAQLERETAKAREADRRTSQHEALVGRGRLVGDELPATLALALADERVCIELGKLRGPLGARGLALLALHLTSTRQRSRRETAAQYIGHALASAVSNGRGAAVARRLDADFDADFEGPDGAYHRVNPARVTPTMFLDGPGAWEHGFIFAALPAPFIARAYAQRLRWDELGLARAMVAGLDKLDALAGGRVRCLFVGAASLDEPEGSIARLLELRWPDAADASPEAA
ncbi:MAG: hypothetical protein K1X94_28510 [Sandaracinaceae bacterium]|nr:hypothetical protein [Sandaracinaceae bacterium]